MGMTKNNSKMIKFGSVSILCVIVIQKMKKCVCVSFVVARVEGCRYLSEAEILWVWAASLAFPTNSQPLVHKALLL